MFRRTLIFLKILPALLLAPAALAELELLTQPSFNHRLADKAVLMSIQPVGQHFLVAGEHGILLDWRDSGRWLQQPSPVSVALTSVTELADGSRIAVGQDAVILVSKAGTSHWRKTFDGYELSRLQLAALEQKQQQLQQQRDQLGPEQDAAELDIQHEELGYSLDDNKADLVTGPNKPLLSIVSAKNGSVFAVGAYGTLLKSTDQGEHWQLQDSLLDNPDKFHLNAITVTADGALYLVGENGLAFSSTSNGESWDALNVPYDGSLFGIVAHGAHLVAFGLQGNILRSHDHGATWQTLAVNTSSSLLGGTINAAGDVVLVGHGGVIVTFNVARPDAAMLLKHPSGAAFSAVAQRDNTFILVGQFGMTVWNKP